MAIWFYSKIRYQREDEAGNLKTITEAYLIDAVSYTDAEARVFEIVASNTPEFQIDKISKMKLTEVFIEPDSERWFKAKVQYISFDESSQKEKKIAHFMLINAIDPGEVYKLLKQKLGTLNDYEIIDINLTDILEVCPYEPKNEMFLPENFKPVILGELPSSYSTLTGDFKPDAS